MVFFQLIFVDGIFVELVQEMVDYIQVNLVKIEYVVQVGDEVRFLLEKEKNEDVFEVIVKVFGVLNMVFEKEFIGVINFFIYFVFQFNEFKRYFFVVCSNFFKFIIFLLSYGFIFVVSVFSIIFNFLDKMNFVWYNVFLQIICFIC